MKTFQSEHGIGDPVIAQTLPARVVAVTFTAAGVLYRVDFDAGGAQTTVDAEEVKARE